MRDETGYDGKPADCWAIGCVLCVLLAGYHPFEDWTSDSQLESLSASPFGESAEQIIDAKKDRHTCYNVSLISFIGVRQRLRRINLNRFFKARLNLETNPMDLMILKVIFFVQNQIRSK
jgi:serine/threonine protein kinase